MRGSDFSRPLVFPPSPETSAARTVAEPTTRARNGFVSTLPFCFHLAPSDAQQFARIAARANCAFTDYYCAVVAGTRDSRSPAWSTALTFSSVSVPIGLLGNNDFGPVSGTIRKMSRPVRSELQTRAKDRLTTKHYRRCILVAR